MSESQKINHIVNIVTSNVDKNIGVTNELIDSLCKDLSPRLYKGLYTSITPPTNQLSKLNSFTIIINVGGHFVTIYAKENFLIYIDPFGLPCFCKSILNFMQNCKRPIFRNNLAVQSFKSKYCGLFAILFVIFFDKPQNKLILKFHPSKFLFKNDSLCLSYLKKLIDE